MASDPQPATAYHQRHLEAKQRAIRLLSRSTGRKADIVLAFALKVTEKCDRFSSAAVLLDSNGLGSEVAGLARAQLEYFCLLAYCLYVGPARVQGQSQAAFVSAFEGLTASHYHKLFRATPDFFLPDVSEAELDSVKRRFAGKVEGFDVATRHLISLNTTDMFRFVQSGLPDFLKVEHFEKFWGPAYYRTLSHHTHPSPASLRSAFKQEADSLVIGGVQEVEFFAMSCLLHSYMCWLCVGDVAGILPEFQEFWNSA